MNREAIVRLLEESGLEAYRESLASLIFPTCQLRLQPEEGPNLPIGCSKVGDIPICRMMWSGHGGSITISPLSPR